MATKPTVRIPDWANTGTKTDPGLSQEATGWVAGDRPPAQWWNWLLGAIGEWLGYADTALDEKLDKVSDSKLTFSGVLSDEDALIQANNDALSQASRRCILFSEHGATDIRVYVTDTGILEVASNCSWVEGIGWLSQGSDEGLVQIIATAAIRPAIYLNENLSGASFQSVTDVSSKSVTAAWATLKRSTPATDFTLEESRNLSISSQSSTQITLAFGDQLSSSNYSATVTSDVGAAGDAVRGAQVLHDTSRTTAGFKIVPTGRATFNTDEIINIVVFGTF